MYIHVWISRNDLHVLGISQPRGPRPPHRKCHWDMVPQHHTRRCLNGNESHHAGQSWWKYMKIHEQQRAAAVASFFLRSIFLLTIDNFCQNSEMPTTRAKTSKSLNWTPVQSATKLEMGHHQIDPQQVNKCWCWQFIPEILTASSSHRCYESAKMHSRTQSCPCVHWCIQVPKHTQLVCRSCLSQWNKMERHSFWVPMCWWSGLIPHPSNASVFYDISSYRIQFWLISQIIFQKKTFSDYPRTSKWNNDLKYLKISRPTGSSSRLSVSFLLCRAAFLWGAREGSRQGDTTGHSPKHEPTWSNSLNSVGDPMGYCSRNSRKIYNLVVT